MAKNNAAIYLLSSRVKLLEKCLLNLYENWNNQYDYPVYVHHFDNIYSEDLKKKIKKNISPNIFFHQIDYKIPSFISEAELYYNRKYLKYVRESFTKKRIGYLHMLHFVSNLTFFGKTGCLVKELEQFDKLMRIDDDSYFKAKIKFDLFDTLELYPFATGYTWTRNTYRELDTREKLWEFYKKYIDKKNITPKNKILQKAIETNDEKLMHNLKWSAGNLNLYDMRVLKNNKEWSEYIKLHNDYGGTFKHRWSDIEIIDLFFHTWLAGPFDLKLMDENLYSNKIPSLYNDFAPSVNDNFNIHNSQILKWLMIVNRFRKNIYKFFK
tara:strand:+ start:46615 stop:47586 length:972 start_codon:yes stop_codon:yes gene_type:complete